MSTIFAMCSGSLPAAISVFFEFQRLSGKSNWKPRQMTYTKLRDQREIIDHAMAVFMPGPHTFTGEDTAEIFVHGSLAVVNSLAECLGGMEDVREAKRGEFTRRAFYNGKMDLNEVRGLENLIRSKTQTQRRLAFGQMRGGEKSVEIRDRLAEMIAKTFTIMDFGEHVEMSLDSVRDSIHSLVDELSEMIKSSRGAEKAQRGINIVLLGRPNSGKSSLLNRLAHRDVAIVSKLPGTTRDSLETSLEIGGVGCRITDTAGLRDDAVDEVESEGIRRAKKKIVAADVVVIVLDPTTSEVQAKELLQTFEDLSHADAKLIIVRNKIDLKSGFAAVNFEADKVVGTNALSSDGVDTLREALSDIVAEICPEATYLLDHRLLSECRDELLLALESPKNDAAIVCGHLERAQARIAELTSSSVTEDVLDKIFFRISVLEK
ncbi:unnamed protein product [Caenorhabditis auriculariae]|uniref:TrmE-type G domain-containing protein n=1 Tax=Caenorhabditis auriculariae TaxID=2777116 RepID=A0A8S1GMQ8_9PELO|nr:unnamed protein product [Caenorhabditis auriculariae]